MYIFWDPSFPVYFIIWFIKHFFRRNLMSQSLYYCHIKTFISKCPLYSLKPFDDHSEKGVITFLKFFWKKNPFKSLIAVFYHTAVLLISPTVCDCHKHSFFRAIFIRCLLPYSLIFIALWTCILMSSYNQHCFCIVKVWFSNSGQRVMRY